MSRPGFSTKEIAQTLGVSRGRTTAAVDRALEVTAERALADLPGFLALWLPIVEYIGEMESGQPFYVIEVNTDAIHMSHLLKTAKLFRADGTKFLQSWLPYLRQAGERSKSPG